MKLPLILDYEIYDEDGPCAPYFTGRITDADGRVMCNAENEERAVELVDHVADLLARHNALREAVAWERECCQDIRPLVAWADLYTRHGDDYVDGVAEDLRAIQDAARAEVDRLIASQGSADCQGEG